jgi:hypothetical protein
MALTIWQGTIAPQPGAGSITFQQSPGSLLISGVSASAPILFAPASGYSGLQGNFVSSWSTPPGQPVADIPAALTAAASSLFILDPSKTYTLTVMEGQL